MSLLVTTPDAQQNASALAEIEHYCGEHPESPAATCRPRVMLRGQKCIALLGSTLEDSVAGIGENVTDALRAFDAEYFRAGKSLATRGV